MDPIVVGKNYCLRLPDGRALGHVRIDRKDDAWAEGAFSPSSSFAEFRELFDREAHLRHQQIIPLWEKAVDALDALGIQVVEEGKGVLPQRLRVYVEGNEAFIGNENSN
jgi:hypothetical protein